MTVTCKRHKSQVIIYSCCPRHLSPKDADIQDSRSTQGKRPRIVPVETPVLKHGTARDRALKTLPKMQPWKSIPTSPFTIKVTAQDWWIPLVWAPEESFGALSVPVSDCIKVIMVLCFWTATFNRTRRAAASRLQLFYVEKEFQMKTLIRRWFLTSVIT